MGGAGLEFNNLGINLLAIVGKACKPSILYLNRNHGEEIQVEITSADINKVWKQKNKGVYALLQHTYDKYGKSYESNPRVLATGPASAATDMGAIVSVPIRDKKINSRRYLGQEEEVLAQNCCRDTALQLLSMEALILKKILR